MMLNNFSRFPSRRPCCKQFALLLVGREGKSELVHQMEASVNHRAAKSPTRLTSLRFNIGESGHYRSGPLPTL